MPDPLMGFIVTARPIDTPVEQLELSSVVASPILAEDVQQAIQAFQESHGTTHAILGVLERGQLQQWLGLVDSLAQKNGVVLN